MPSNVYSTGRLLKLAVCLILCVGATLDDISYVSSLRVRTASLTRASGPMVDDDSDHPHTCLTMLESIAAVRRGVAPEFSALWRVTIEPDSRTPVTMHATQSARAPPPTLAGNLIL